MWVFQKSTLLRRIKSELLMEPFYRPVRTKTIIFILQDLIENNRDYLLKLIGGDCVFNPLNNLPLMIHIIENWKLLNNFPKHKILIKKIIKV